MSSLRTRLSGAIAWGMIPLAVWSGLPSTGCLCADGVQRLFCPNLHLGVPRWAGTSPATISGGEGCCLHPGQPVGRPPAECLVRSHAQQGYCGRCGATRPAGSRPCCTPTFTAPATMPASAVLPLAAEQGMDLHTAALDVPHTYPAPVASKTVSLDTGPPVDLAITLCRLVI